ncbi:E3 ubiquitin-protein ligase lubel isoform X2 [Anastrepha ludens]|uniref:E3 ubiquitin-protein ligase lubel isoform X2 n=1 Tax=Anastrepha ludens TaxID=28586 RepID=UPI0023B0C66C|nr:E3 ubiquitin-protein ligase lubel isoform X2 [Anastrepha ludens]
MATHTNANTFSTKLHRNVLTMPKWVTETHDRVGPKPPPPPSPTTPDSGVKLPVLPPKSKNLPEPDYEVIEFSGQQYSNEVLKAGSRSKTPSTPDAKLKCTLCGSHNPWVTCEECAQQIFCASCDDMFHKHPKRRAHVRKAVEQTRPPLPPKILPGQNGPTPPVAPPRRKGRGFATPLLQRKEQVDMNTLPIPPSPTPSLRSTSWQDRVSSLKSGLNLMNRPLPDTPKTPTSEHTSSRSVTPKSVFDSIQRPPSVTLEKIKSKASATLDRMTLLQQRYRQHKADSQRSNNDCSGSVTDQNLSFDQWSNISPSPSHFRSGSMSSGINSSHFDLTDDTHFHNMFNQRQMHPSTAQQQRANGQLGTRGMSTSVFNLSHINRRAPEPQNTWMNNPMQQAQSMAHLNCATCASPQTNAWHAHTQRHMPMANVQTDGWGNQFPSQQQLNRSNLSLNVGAGYMMPHHHGASGMMAPPPVFMNQTGMMTGMYPYPYHGGMPVMNPGIMGMPPPTRSRATSRAGSRAASPAMSRKSMPVRRKQRTTSYVEDELTDDEDSDQDDRRSIISNRSGMTNTLRARQRRISSASQLLDDESETNQRQTRGKLRDARDRRGSIAKSVQSDWLPSRRPTVNHSSSSNRQNEPGFVNTNKPTRIYSDLDSESSGTRALVQAKIQEKLEKSTKRSSSKEKIAEAARQKPNKVSTEVQAGGSRTIAKSASATAVKAEENQAPVKQNTGKYESVQIKANKKEASEDDEEEEEEEEVEESGSEETESEQEEEEQVAEVSTQLEEGNASQAVDASEANEDDLGPPPSTPDHEWECEFCTYVNEPNVKICLICCKTPSHGARKTSTTTAPTPSVSEEQPTKVSAATSLSPERASVDKEKRTSSTERTKDKPKDKVKEKPKDKVTSTSTSTSTGTTAIPKRKTGVAQSIISNLTNGMSKLKITSSEHNSGATTLTKKKESVEEVWAALDDNIQATANEIMRKAEKSKKSTKVSTSCGTSPIREVPKAKDAQKLQRSVKETGTSPPPQSISTQTYDTLPLRQPEPSVAETVATGGGGIFYSENSQEAELYKFTPEELHAALKYCGTSTHPIQWLRENWHKLIQTVQSLSTKYGQERAENIIGTISQIEAREALRQHGGNIWQAVSECIEQRQRKYRDISSKGNFSREDIVTALTIHQGNADLALLDLGRTQLKPFLMRIRGSPAGVENESGAIFPPASPIEHTIQPEIHDFLSANASECLQTPNAAGAAFITDHPSPLHEQSTNEYRNPMFDGIYRYSPYSREASSSSFHLDDPAFNNRNMLKDLETLIGNIEQNQAKENEPMLKTMETMLGDSLGKREVEHENDPEMMRILMKSPIATQYAKRTLSNANSRSQSQLDVKNFVWQHIQEIVPNLVQQVEMELMADDAQEANTAGEIMIDQKLQPPEPPPIDAEEFILEEVIGPNIKEASIRELVPPEFVYAAEIANFRMEFDRALDREHEEEFDFDSCDEAERTIYKMYTAPEEEKLSAEKEDAAEFSIPEIEGENLTEDSKVKSENEREDLAEELSDTQAMGASAAHKSQITSETEETERHDEQENEQLTEQVTNGTVVNDGNNKIEIPNEQNEEARKSAEKVTDNSPEISIANANEQRKVPQTEESNAFNEEQPSRSNRASQETLVNVAAALSNESNEATTSTTVVPQVLEEADTPAAVSFTDTSKLKRNEKMQRRQRKSQLPKNVNGPELKVGGDMRRTDAKDRHITKSSNKQQEATPPNDENLQQKAENEDAASSEDLLAEHALDAKTPHEASSTDNTKPNQEAPNLKDRQPRVSRIPVRRSGSRISGEQRSKKPSQLTVVEAKLTNKNEVQATNTDRVTLERPVDSLSQPDRQVDESVSVTENRRQVNLESLHESMEQTSEPTSEFMSEEAVSTTQAEPSSIERQVLVELESTQSEDSTTRKTSSNSQTRQTEEEPQIQMKYEISVKTNTSSVQEQQHIGEQVLPAIIQTTAKADISSGDLNQQPVGTQTISAQIEITAGPSSKVQNAQLVEEQSLPEETEATTKVHISSEDQSGQLVEEQPLPTETVTTTKVHTSSEDPSGNLFAEQPLPAANEATIKIHISSEDSSGKPVQGQLLPAEADATVKAGTSSEDPSGQLVEEQPFPAEIEATVRADTSSEDSSRQHVEETMLPLASEETTQPDISTGETARPTITKSKETIQVETRSSEDIRQALEETSTPNSSEQAILTVNNTEETAYPAVNEPSTQIASQEVAQIKNDSEKHSSEEFQDAAELSADEEFDKNERSVSKRENGDDDNETSDDELYSIESEFSSRGQARSVTSENEVIPVIGKESQPPIQQSTSDTAIDANLAKKSRQTTAVEFVLSPDASKQNLSELVEDTQRLIKQMKDEINIEDFESTEEEYTDEYTDEDEYDEDEGEEGDWEESFEEEETDYDEDALTEDDFKDEDYFDEEDEDGLDDEDDADEVKVEGANADKHSTDESAREHQAETADTAEQEIKHETGSASTEDDDKQVTIIPPSTNTEIVITYDTPNATDPHHAVPTALLTKLASTVEPDSLTNANESTTYANLIESEAMEIEVENQTPELPVETVLSNDKRAEIKLKTSGNESQIDAAMRNEQVQEESSERQSSDHQEVYQHADTQAMATQSNVEPTVVEKTIDTKSQNSLSRTENEHASSAAEPKTAVSSKGGAVSKIPQIRTDASEASTSNSLRSTMSITRNNKVGLQKSAIPSAKSMAEQAKPKESKIPKQTPKKVPLRSKSFSGPPGPIGISSVKAIQQEFLKRQNQLTTRYEPPKNPPTIVRKESIVEAITKYMPSTSASASGSKTIAAASIFRTHARIPKKKYHETCFSDDDYETTASEEEPEPLEIRQRKQSVPVFRAYPSVQELEVVPTEVLVRKFVDEKLVASVAEAQIAATLVNMRFQQDVSIWAAKECSDLDQAISMLQQDCELCMGIYPMNQIVSMLKCTHKCCKQCAKTYFTVQITDRSINDCTCPFCKLPELHGHNEHEDENLEYFSNLDIFLKNILDAEVHELFQRKLRDRTLLQDPNFKWCIQCSSGFFARPKQKRLICPDCGSVTCAQCRKAWEKQHEGISCEQFKEWKEANDPEVQAQGVQEHLAQNGIDCPKCKFRYSLARGGCMHFTCTQCKYEFCYGCGKPFMMGAKCTISSYCAKLGLHAHHPRNCLFYLRDKLPIQLQMLLKQNNIPYDEDPIELPNADAEDASTSTPKSARCPIALQKETPTGLVDTVCNGEVPDKHAGLCRTHYVEYLTAKVAKARIDPLPIFDLTDCVQELRRRDIRLPERGPWDTDEIYKGMCSEVIKNNIPLETM